MKTLRHLCRFDNGLPSERAAKVVLVFALLMPLAVIGQSTQVASASGGVVMKTVKEKIVGHEFSFKIPKGWKRTAKADEITWRDANKKRAFSVKLLNVGTTWYKSFSLSPLDYFEQQIRPSFVATGWTIDKAEMTAATRLGGARTARITVTIPATSSRVSMRQIYSILPGGGMYGVVVLVSAPASDFARAKSQVFDAVLKSFRVTKQPKPFQ